MKTFKEFLTEDSQILSKLSKAVGKKLTFGDEFTLSKYYVEINRKGSTVYIKPKNKEDISKIWDVLDNLGFVSAPDKANGDIVIHK